MQKVAQSWLVFDLTQVVVLPRARRLPRPAADPALHARSAASSPIATIAGGCCSARSTSRWRRRSRSPRWSSSAHVHIWHILALSFITGFAQAFGGPAYQSLIPSLVDKKDLPNAIALNSIQFNLARVFGPLLAGTTLAAFGAAACFGLNGLSFLVVIVALMSLHDEAHPAGRSQADAAGAEGRPRLRAQRAGDHRADRARVADDVPGAAAADVPAGLRARRSSTATSAPTAR